MARPAATSRAVWVQRGRSVQGPNERPRWKVPRSYGFVNILFFYCEKISDCLHSAAVMLALSLLTTSFQLQRAPLAHTITAARSSAVRMGEPGTPANIDDYKEYEFSKRKTTDDGSCFIVDDKEAPDPARSWFYCDEYASTAFPRFKIVCPRHVR